MARLSEFYSMQKSGISRISFHYLVPSLHFRDRTKVKDFLFALFRKHNKGVEAINYIFCSDKYLLGLNREYLRHNTFTDIISFELSAVDEPLIADIYISVERVRENAKAYGTSFKKELHRVIFHGALHLCGFKDKTFKDGDIMKSMENRCLAEYFVSREMGLKINKIRDHH
jgi:rRNA maturation RNase YbeY